MTKSTKVKLHWQLSFDINPDLTIGRDGEAIRKATAIAKRGELAYMAELELSNWAEDLAAFFEQVRAVFFEAKVNGVPAFPTMDDPEPEPPSVESPASEPEREPSPNNEPAAEMDDLPGADEYDIEYYPADIDVEDVDEAQPSLF